MAVKVLLSVSLNGFLSNLLSLLTGFSLNRKNQYMTSKRSWKVTFSVWIFAALTLFTFTTSTYADTEQTDAKKPTESSLKIAQEKQKKQLTTQTLTTLLNFVELQDQLRNDLDDYRKSVKNSLSDTELKDLKGQITTTEEKLKETELNLENIAADTDLALLRNNKEEEFNLQKELLSY